MATTTDNRHNQFSTNMPPAKIAMGVFARRLIALPFIVVLGMCNLLYSVRQASSPFDRSTTIAAGPDEIQYVREFVRTPHELEVRKHGRRELHELHKEGNPSLIFHVGPLHTYSSDLQAELGLLSSELADDKYTLASRSSSLVTDFACHKELNLARREFDVQKKKGVTGDKLLKEHLSTEVKCWREALKNLETHRANGESIIFSDESLSNRWFPFEDLSLAPLDWRSLQETVGDLWNIEIVVGYRRFAEWFPEAVRAASEARHQEFLQAKKPLRPIEDEKDTKPFFPDLVLSAAADEAVAGAYINATYTSTVIERFVYRGPGKPNIPVTMLNVHLDKTVGTTFVCDILYSARRACRASPVPRGSTAERAYELKKLRDEPIQVHDFYDFLVKYAAEHNMYRSNRIPRQSALAAVRVFQEETHSMTVADFPVKRLPDAELLKLLQVSLKHERNLLPVFFHSHDGEDEHRRKFWETSKTSKMLYALDVKKVLRDRKVRDFFRALPVVEPEVLTTVPKNKPNEDALGEAKIYISADNEVRGTVTTTIHRRKLVV